jgi:hypothetical protein
LHRILDLSDMIALHYLLDDVPSARQIGARLHGILARLDTDKALTAAEESYLDHAGYRALLTHAKGETSREAFVQAARQEQEARAAQKPVEVPRPSAPEQKAVDPEWLAESQRHNAKLFAAAAARDAWHKIFDDLDLGYIPRKDFPTVKRIADGVTGGKAISEADLIWLATEGADYATEALMAAHHRILARAHAKAWAETGDPWEAVNACSNWRKGNEPREGLDIAAEALAKTRDRRTRSALCTTRGGALRDLGRPEEAKTMGLEAHGLNDSDFRPCTLLGACCIELRDYQAAAEWYAKAEARGASAQSIDADIWAILRAAAPSRRAEILKALKALDPDRFGRFG